MDDRRLVSVVMPVYNSVETVGASIESVLAQTYDHIELLIVDDGSSDGSADLADSFAKLSQRVTVMRCGRQGVVEARNAATRRARGSLVAYCDSDDLWHPEKLARQIAFMRSSGSLISATAFTRIDEAGVPISGVVDVPRTISYAELLATNSVCCASVVYDASSLGKVFMYDYRQAGPMPLYMRIGNAKPLHEDYIAWARLLSTGVVIDGLNEPLTYYRVRRNSHSSNKFAAAVARWYINANVLKVPFHQNVVRFGQYALRALYRRVTWRLSAREGRRFV